MKYVIMAAGANKKWNNYLGIPKHLVKIGSETLLGRTTRLLKENGINDYIITCNNGIYKEYGETFEPTKYDCEIDRFEETFLDAPVCFLYGDVYYSEDAMKTIIDAETNDVLWIGSESEMFAIKIQNYEHFKKAKLAVKQLFLSGQISRCICWEIYRYMHNIPFNEHYTDEDYIDILDETDDIDFPENYEDFKWRIEHKVKNNIRNCVSVIIPCYNNADNTKKILNKLLHQKHTYYPETEIIVVENGSTEDMSFLDQYNKNDVVVLHETITGVSHARNTGLDRAKGEYIAFIDNDDDIADDYLHCLYKAMRTENSKYDFCLIPSYSDGQLIVDYSTIDLTNPVKRIWSVWHYCYNRRIIGDIRFNENLNVAEDIAWLRLVLPEDKIQNGILIEKPIYFYKWANNENSLSHRFNRKEITRERGE